MVKEIVLPEPVTDNRVALAADHIEEESLCLFALDLV